MLVECAEQARPMLVFTDLESTRNNICSTIARLRQNPATKHLPIVAFGGEQTPDLQQAAQAAGVTLIVSEQALLNHLAECLQQALEVE
jgi:CheY-like chemotaxis protein